MDVLNIEGLNWLSVGSTICVIILLYWTADVVYNLSFHPLRRVPGPLLWRATRLGFIHSLVSGNLVCDVRQFHERYGSVVRTAPNEVSFAREDAWHDAFGRKPLLRNPTFFKAPPGQPDNLITTVNDSANARMRQVIMPALNERALAKQEPTVQAYTGLLVARLMERARAPENGGQNEAVINIVDWFNWFTFDLVGDLALAMALAASTRYYTGLESFLLQLIPPSIRKMQAYHYATALEKIHRRMATSVPRDDFMTPMLENNVNFERMSLPEIESTMSLMLIAGSETTGTTLCGVTNYLVQNPQKLRKLEEEIRDAFKREEEITFKAIQNLPFLNAVLCEGLRLCNPVATGIMRIVPKGGASMCGYYLPEGTHVAINSVSMSLSETNFHRATEFLPERFLPEGSRPAEFDGDRRNTQKPFGLGPRSCIGKSFALAEMRLVVARLVWNFDLSMAAGRQVDWNDFKTFVVVQKEPITIKISARLMD